MHSQITEVTESHDKIYFVMLTSVANTCQQKSGQTHEKIVDVPYTQPKLIFKKKYRIIYTV